MKNFIQRGGILFLFFLLLGHFNRLSAQDRWDGSIASNFNGGNGTSNNPYQICTGAQMMYFIDQINSGQTFEGKTVRLMNDIDMRDPNLTSFQTTAPFDGTFDGHNNILTINFDNFHNGGTSIFRKVRGRINRLGIIATLGVAGYGSMSITDTLEIGGIIENCFSHGSSGSMMGEKAFMARVNYGTIRNCYAKGVFWDIYVNGGSQFLVSYNNTPGVIENCYLTGSSVGAIYYGVVKYNYSGQGLVNCYTECNENTIASLNAWVNKHSGYSSWGLTGYNLDDFNPNETCSVTFVDTLFHTQTSKYTITPGSQIGELPIPYADCTFLGWTRFGSIVSEDAIVEDDWTLFAKWEQRIRKQPSRDEMSIEVDDIEHALFQWYAIYGSIQTFANWQSTNHGRDTESSKTITITAIAGQVFKFYYTVSCEQNYDTFSFLCNGQVLLTASGEKRDQFSYTFAEDGTYTMVFLYSKDDETSKGADMVTVYDISCSNPENILNYQSPLLPSRLISKEGMYYCKVSYENTGVVLTTDKVSFGIALKGDVNDDGKVTSDDVNTLTDVILGKLVLNNTMYNIADVNNDNVITIGDVTKLVNMISRK